jgi:hypothetical protein
MDTMYVTIGVLGYVALALSLYLDKREEERGKRESARLQVERENFPNRRTCLHYSELEKDPSEAVKISVGLLKDEMNASTSPVVKQSIERLLVLIEKEI